MKQRHQTVLCREGWYYLLVLALVLGGALVREVNLLLVLAGMLAGPVLLSWRLARVTLRGLEIHRKMPHGVCAGDLLVVQLKLTNTRRRVGSWAVAVEEPIRFNDEQPVQAEVFFSYVPPGESRRGIYRGRLPRRGRYLLGPLRVSTRFPFGLIRGTITVGRPQALIVFPRLGRLTRRWITRQREAFEGSQRRHRRHGRVEGDLFGVREWRSGDSRRWIHWRSSARHGSLVVRQFEQTQNRDLTVLVDLWQPTTPEPEHLENVELAISFAATVVADLCGKGGSNLMVDTTGTRPLTSSGPASVALLEEVMEQLAVAEADHEDRLPDLLDHALGRIEPGTEVVLISTRAVNLHDRRFDRLWIDPTRGAMARKMRCINTAGNQLEEYFQPD